MVREVRKIIVIAALIIVFYLLQTTICKWMIPSTAVPNLLLILAMSWGLLRGRVEGMFVGFFCGLLLDVFSGKMLCFFALIYMNIGYINGKLRKTLVSDLPLLPMILCGFSELAYHFYIYVCSFLTNNRLNFTVYLEEIIMPEMVATIFVNIFAYWLILLINNKLEEVEKKEGGSRFVA